MIQKVINGFSLIELMIVVAIGAIIIAFAIPAYEDYVDSANVASAKADLIKISQAIEQHYLKTNAWPMNLTDIGFENYKDPWGNTFRYLNISTVTGLGPLRKDRNINPVNSDYDLYSIGKDGESSLNFAARKALDDVVRANNGNYIGLASDY